MQQGDLIDICAKLCAITRTLGQYMLEEQKKIDFSTVEEKGTIDFVTHVDKEVDRRLVNSLREFLPSAGFISEESGKEGGGNECCWVIDPIDGTTNFIHNAGPFCISVALMQNGTPVLGVVYELTRNELFYAWQGSRAYLNGQPIVCSPNRQLAKAMIGYGFSYDSKKTRKIAPAVSALSEKTSTRCLGSAAAELCYVARGAYNAYFHNDLKIWDIAAAALILKQAGGDICTFGASSDFLHSKEIIAYNNTATRDTLMKLLQENAG